MDSYTLSFFFNFLQQLIIIYRTINIIMAYLIFFPFIILTLPIYVNYFFSGIVVESQFEFKLYFWPSYHSTDSFQEWKYQTEFDLIDDIDEIMVIPTVEWGSHELKKFWVLFEEVIDFRKPIIEMSKVDQQHILPICHIFLIFPRKYIICNFMFQLLQSHNVIQNRIFLIKACLILILPLILTQLLSYYFQFLSIVQTVMSDLLYPPPEYSTPKRFKQIVGAFIFGQKFTGNKLFRKRKEPIISKRKESNRKINIKIITRCQSSETLISHPTKLLQFILSDTHLSREKIVKKFF